MSLGGYPAIAECFARDSDRETFIFRRFDELTASNLLNMQSELIHLEARLKDLNNKAHLSNWDPILQLSIQGYRAIEPNHDTDCGQERRRIMADLEEKLKRYHKALLLSQSVARLDSPSTRVLKACEHVYGEHLAVNFEKAGLVGARDFGALKPPRDQDVLSKTIRKYWPFLSRPAQDSSNLRYFEEDRLSQLVSAISIFIAAALVIGPILALNFVSSTNTRLGITIAFIVLFASGLSLSTGVSRDNVFIATATYSAVLVVFVSGSLGGSVPESSSNVGHANSTVAL